MSQNISKHLDGTQFRNDFSGQAIKISYVTKYLKIPRWYYTVLTKFRPNLDIQHTNYETKTYHVYMLTYSHTKTLKIQT